MTDPQFMFFQYRLSMIFLLAFQLLFLQLRNKWWKSGLIALGSFGITGLLDCITFFSDFWTGNLLVITIVQIVIVQATAYILCCYRDFRTLFTGISSSTIVLPGNVISMAMFSCTGSIFVSLLIQVLAHLILLGIITVVLRWNYLRELENYRQAWGKLCVLPALFYLVMYTLAYWPSNIYERKENWLAAFLFLILMSVTYILLIKLVSQQHMENELERSDEFLKTYAWGLQREADALRRADEKMRVLRHDSRHVYQMIGTYLEEGKTEQIKKLLRELDSEFESISSERFCENITVNGILSCCEAKAGKAQIGFVCEADIPREMKTINEFELATVLSNLLENAIQAASKVQKQENRKVTVRIFPVKGQLILEIANTYMGECKFSPVTGLPLSTRGEGHGYGLRSVEAYANKNHAVFQYSVEDELFCVRLLTNI